MAVSAGRYRHRIKVLKRTNERDKYGGSENKRTEISYPWCKVTPISDTEDNGTTTVGQLILEFEIRYSKSLENPTSDMFIEFKGSEYDITSVINHLELNEKLKIMAKKR